MTNLWKRKPLTTNPYYEAAFQILGLTPDATRSEIAQRGEERLQAVMTIPGFYKVGERPLVKADITSAREVLLDPNRSILEELLVHEPEALPADQVKRAAARLAPPAHEESTILPPPRLAFLIRAVLEIAGRLIPPVEIPAFPVSLEITPPYGGVNRMDDDLV